MNRMLICALLGMTVGVVLGPEFATAQISYKNVFVQASSNGRGLLRARGTQCWAITPGHVVGTDASTIRLIAPDARVATGGLVQRFDGLAAVEVLGLEEDACAEWPVTDGLPELMVDAVDATIVGLTEAGTEELVAVDIVEKDNTYFYVRPKNSRDKIIQGFSGSAVYINRAVAGIVTQVDPDGRGVVYRIDRVEQIMGAFFAGVVPSTSTCTIFAPSHTDTDIDDIALRVYVNDEYEGQIQLMPYSGDELEFDCSEGSHSYRLTATLAGTGSCEGEFEVFGQFGHRKYVVDVYFYRYRLMECELVTI